MPAFRGDDGPFRRKPGGEGWRNPGHHRTQRRRKDLHPQLHQRILPSPAGGDFLPEQKDYLSPSPPHRRTGYFPHLPEHRALHRPEYPGQPHGRAAHPHAPRGPGRFSLFRPHAPGGDRPPENRRGYHRFPGAGTGPEEDGGPPPLRPAQAGGTGPGPGPGAESTPPRRAHGRDERGRKGRHGPVHHRHLGAKKDPHRAGGA